MVALVMTVLGHGHRSQKFRLRLVHYGGIEEIFRYLLHAVRFLGWLSEGVRRTTPPSIASYVSWWDTLVWTPVYPHSVFFRLSGH